MFPPKYLPFSSYIISPFLIIFSLSLPYYLSPLLSFPTSIIISLFSFHPLIIYLPSLIFSFLQQSQKEVFHLPKKIRFGYIIKFIDLWIGLQIFTFLQTRILCLCECTLSICLDHNKESRSLIKTKQKYWMGALFFLESARLFKENKKIKQITIASLFLFIILILKAVIWSCSLNRVTAQGGHSRQFWNYVRP